MNEIACIHLATNQDSSYDSDLIGATVVITNDDTDETILSTTWSGEDIVAGIQNMINYSVEVGNITGYATPQKQSFYSKVGYSRAINFTYNTEIAQIACSSYDGVSVSGRTVTVNNEAYTLDSSGLLNVKIPYGTTYDVTFQAVSGYRIKSFTNQTANSVNKQFNSIYKLFTTGVFVYTVQDELYTAAQFTAAKNAGTLTNADAVGVAVITSNYRFGIYGGVSGLAYTYNNDSRRPSGLQTYTTTTAAWSDFNGLRNTTKFAEAFGYSTSYLAGYALSKTAKNGSQCYVGTAGELKIAWDNKSAILDACSACGITHNYYTKTSTYYGDIYLWHTDGDGNWWCANADTHIFNQYPANLCFNLGF